LRLVCKDLLIALDHTHLFAQLIARTAKDVEVLIDSLPSEESSAELQSASLLKLEEENREAAQRLEDIVQQVSQTNITAELDKLNSTTQPNPTNVETTQHRLTLPEHLAISNGKTKTAVANEVALLCVKPCFI